jgi:hypothetical protein
VILMPVSECGAGPAASKNNQQANRYELGSKGGRPPAFDREAYKDAGTIDVASIRTRLRDPAP